MENISKTSILWRIIIVLFCLVLITTVAFSSIAAKFISSDSLNPSASAATFHGGKVTAPAFSAMGINVEGNVGTVKYYVFEAEITLTFDACEVDRHLNYFRLYLDDTGETESKYSTLHCPANASGNTFVKNTTGTTYVDTTLSDMTGLSADFTANKIYYSVSIDGGAETWNAVDYNSSSPKINLLSNVDISKEQKEYKFTFLFFVKAEVVGSGTEQLREKVYIKYDLDCEQKEG